jgi:type II secretory pathway component GspD/PulD (secretin)
MCSPRLITALALLALALTAQAQRPGDPGEEGETEMSVRYTQDDLDPGERARLEVIDTRDNIDYVVRTYHLEHANAADLFRVINEAVEQEEGRVDTLAIGGEARFDTGTGEVMIVEAGDTFMVITAPEWMFPGLDRTIEMLDREGISSWDDGTLDAYFMLEHRRPSEVAEFLAEYATERTILIPDDATNALYVNDAPENFRAMVRAIAAFDTPAQAVMIEAEIIEIVRDDNESLGIWWDAWKMTLPTDVDAAFGYFSDRGRNSDIDARVTEAGLTGVISGLTPEHTRSQQFTVATSLDNMSPQALASFVNYLIGEGHARVLTSPRITVLQTETGVIESATQHQTVALLQQDDEGARIFTDVVTSEGVRLEVTPFIGADTIRLDVNAEVSSVIGLSATGLPITATRGVESQAVLRDGERLTLAGLTREQIISENSGVPVLRRVPLVRYLFSRETEVRRTSDIVVFLTPRAVQPGGEYRGQRRDSALREEIVSDLMELRD